MVCHEGSWKAVQKDKRGKSKAAPCTDAKTEDWCLAEKGHCNQFTDKGMEMERDCSGTCGQINIYPETNFSNINCRVL